MPVPIAAAVSGFQALGKHWKPIAIIICIGLLTIYIQSLHGKIKDERLALADLNAKYLILENDYNEAEAQYLANETTFKNTIELQNQSIDSMNDDLVAYEIRLNKVIKDMEDQQAKHEKEVSSILAGDAPSSCEATTIYLIEAMETLPW